jgi:hypothetical protein
MLLAPLGLFVVAALFGLYMAFRVFAGAFAPWAASILHLLLGASGLVLLAVAYLQNQLATPAAIGFAILVLAALGGLAMGVFHLQKKLPPKGLVVVHAGAAVIGVGTLAASALNLI